MFKTTGLECGEAGTRPTSLGSWSAAPSSAAHVLVFQRTGRGPAQVEAAQGCLRMGKSQRSTSPPAQKCNHAFFSLFLTSPTACPRKHVHEPPDQGRLLVPRQDQPAFRASQASGRLCSHNPHSAGVCRVNLWPRPRAKSHLRR